MKDNKEVAYQAMRSAHAHCPSDLPHLDKMRWMSQHFLKEYAGSATGIDLSALEQLARAADQGEGQHVYTHPRDSNKWRDNANWQHAADPATVLALIALARATPLEQTVAWMKPDEIAGLLNAANKRAGARHYGRVYARQYDADMVPVVARATPQHSVTEQTSIDTPSFRQRLHSARMAVSEAEKRAADAELIAYIDRRAQPLASPAATQPEQASIKLWSERAYEGGMHVTERACMLAEIADLRAALAIPASTARDVCAEMRALCSACGGTGDVHSITGEWRGSCDCQASTAAPVGVAVEWQNGSIDFVRGNPNQAALDHWKQCGAIARPLVYASPAATQPEQASIETWENRYNAMPGGLSDSDVRKCMEAEIADLRAAVAALTHRATTAPSIVMECVRDVAAGNTNMSHLTEEVSCAYCGTNLDKGDDHKADCLTMRARAYLAAAPGTATTAADQQGDTASADERDAARYRWLRDEAWGGHVVSKKFPHVVEFGPGLMRSGVVELAEDALDTAIDEAIAAMAAPANQKKK